MRITAISKHHRRGLRGCSALASAATLTAMTAVLATASPPAQAAASSHPAMPDAISTDSTLQAVSAVSATDAWAVGSYAPSSGPIAPLILQWNGTAWKAVKNPVLPSGEKSAGLVAVSAVSATDAWAAGYYYNSSEVNEPLLLHWTGTTWKVVTSPAPGGAEGTYLEGVSAVSATDAWAAGYYDVETSLGSLLSKPLLLHWTGTAWKQVTTPAPSGAMQPTLSGVSAVSATDAWAVGSYGISSGAEVPLILHWTGKAWKVVTSPAPSGAKYTYPNGVSAVSATDAWAAGWYGISSGVKVPLTLHWTGKAWKVVASPAPSGAEYTDLSGVSAVSATDAWAVGDSTNSSRAVETLTLHWTGTAWKIVTSPNGS
jgi:hypothetical protein